MKIQHIRFKNLNSLVGEWHIDLTQPAYVVDGIFAITGPTGAGKTTILDAICLALYGSTPRLNKVTQGTNEIMSRQTAECFAEVIFETKAGRYRCHWAQHRARRKADGELQSPKHEIVNHQTGDILESSLRGVALQVESTTGMSFEQFTRSMLLAQGSFSAFLQASPDERSPLLEKITGTEIYSRISIRVHELQRAEQEKLKLLQAETAGMLLLEPEQEQEIRQTLQANQTEQTQLQLSSSQTKLAIDWLNTIHHLEQEITQLNDESTHLQQRLQVFAPQHEKLKKALSAASLDGLYATLLTFRQQHRHDKNEFNVLSEKRPALEASAQTQAALVATAEQKSAAVKRQREEAAPIWQEVRALDQQLAEKKKQVLECENEIKTTTLNINVNKHAQRQQQQKQQQIHDDQGLIDNYFNNHAQDEWLISGLAGLQEQLTNLQSQQTEIVQKEQTQDAILTTLEQAKQSLQQHQAHCQRQTQALDQASQSRQQAQQQLQQLLAQRLLRELRADKEALLREMVFLNTIVKLEDQRAKLQAGQACPLCGATEHPFAQGHTPAIDETEQRIQALTAVISKAEEQELLIKSLEVAENKARHDLVQVEKKLLTAINHQNTAQQALTQSTQALAALQTQFNHRSQAVSDILRPLGVLELPSENIAGLVDEFRARFKTWQSQTQKKSELEKQATEIEIEIKRLGAVIETQSLALKEKQLRLSLLRGESANLGQQRIDLYGQYSPDEQERQLNQAVLDAEENAKQTNQQYQSLQQELHTVNTSIMVLSQRLEEQERSAIKHEMALAEGLALIGFSTEAQLLAASLSATDRAELAAELKELELSQTDLNARKKDREMRLTMEREKALTSHTLNTLSLDLHRDETTLQALSSQIAELAHRLKVNATTQALIKEKQQAIAAQRKEWTRWQTLHELIGSADGKKYRNFAQGLTFEMMVVHANQQLQKMTDRYVLVRHVAQPLELSIIDNYQAAQMRSTKNLSGGESFIISLSLALGLSQMASKNVQVDSLFLDEGFGTLDEEALDIALDTLAGLQQDGKLIGVISHVSALKERISTQIQVRPKTGGKSQIVGPGCSYKGS